MDEFSVSIFQMKNSAFHTIPTIDNNIITMEIVRRSEMHFARIFIVEFCGAVLEGERACEDE